MKKIFKFTDAEMRTKGGFRYEIGKKAKAGEGDFSLCGDGALHFYTHPRLAVLFAPTHISGYDPSRLFEGKAHGEVRGDGTKCAAKAITLLKEVDIWQPTTEQRVEFGIRAAMLVCKDEKWREWAERWLIGEDRAAAAARAAAAGIGTELEKIADAL